MVLPVNIELIKRKLEDRSKTIEIAIDAGWKNIRKAWVIVTEKAKMILFIINLYIILELKQSLSKTLSF
jgi:hypothetical protein